MAGNAEAPRRLWADVITIVAGLALLALGIWPGRLSASNAVAVQLGNASALWVVHAAAGALAIAGVIIAQRWSARSLARIMVLLAGAALMVVFFVFRDFDVRAWLTVFLPAILLLLAGFNIGPMPGPQEVPLKS